MAFTGNIGVAPTTGYSKGTAARLFLQLARSVSICRFTCCGWFYCLKAASVCFLRQLVRAKKIRYQAFRPCFPQIDDGFAVGAAIGGFKLKFGICIFACINSSPTSCCTLSFLWRPILFLYKPKYSRQSRLPLLPPVWILPSLITKFTPALWTFHNAPTASFSLDLSVLLFVSITSFIS